MCWAISIAGRLAPKKSSMLVNRSTMTYRLRVLTRQMTYARTNEENSIRSRMVTGVRGQRSEVRGQKRAESLLTSGLGPLTSDPGLVQVKILVDVIVGRGRLAVAVTVGPEFAHRVGHGPPLILHPIDGRQGAGPVQPGHAVDQDRVVALVVAQLEEVVNDRRPVVRTRLVPRQKAVVAAPAQGDERRPGVGTHPALGNVRLVPVPLGQERVRVLVLQVDDKLDLVLADLLAERVRGHLPAPVELPRRHLAEPLLRVVHHPVAQNRDTDDGECHARRDRPSHPVTHRAGPKPLEGLRHYSRRVPSREWGCWVPDRSSAFHPPPLYP